MSCATSVGLVAATPNTDAPRKVLYGFSAARVSARNEAIDRSGVVFSPGNRIVESGPSGRRT
jgi:hypothetical protein